MKTDSDLLPKGKSSSGDHLVQQQLLMQAGDVETNPGPTVTEGKTEIAT